MLVVGVGGVAVAAWLVVAVGGTVAVVVVADRQVGGALEVAQERQLAGACVTPQRAENDRQFVLKAKKHTHTHSVDTMIVSGHNQVSCRRCARVYACGAGPYRVACRQYEGHRFRSRTHSSIR